MSNRTQDNHLGCTDCRLHENRIQVVLPDTDPANSNTLVAIGEAPGADEDREGVGFAGRAGRTLDQVLADNGITRTGYARANMCCCRPPNNRKPGKRELAACEGWLEWWMTTQMPVKVILAVGGTPSQYFYQTGSLSEAIDLAEKSGYVPLIEWAANAGIKVVPSPHVSPLAWNRSAPSGEKWSEVGKRQIALAVGMVMCHL